MQRVFGWVRGHALISVAVAFFVGLAAGSSGKTAVDSAPATSSTDAEASADVEEVEDEPVVAEEVEEEEPAPVAQSEASFSRTCDYLLGDQYELIGDSRVKNTGNIGIVAEIIFEWRQAGTMPIKEKKTVRLSPGAAKTVRANIVATSDQIDRLQAMPYGQQCKVRGRIIEEWGTPQ